EARTKIGLIYLEKGDPDRAAQEFDLVLAAEPQNWRVRYYLGSVYAERKEIDRALEEFGKIPADSDFYVDARIQRAYLMQKAERLIRRALEIEPDDGFYVDSLGWVYYQRGDYGRAVEQLERAVELAGDDPTVAEHLGDAYERAGKPRDALRLYQDALARAKEAAQIERLKGKVHSLEAA